MYQLKLKKNKTNKIKCDICYNIKHKRNNFMYN